MRDTASSSPEFPFLSPAEWRVFSLISKKGPLTVRQLVSELAATSETPHYTTVLTLTQRVAAKGYLHQSEKAAPHGPASAITYSSSASYVDALRRHAKRFLDQYGLHDPEDLDLIREIVDQ